MPAAHRTGLQSNVLRRAGRVSAKDQLRRLARGSDESNFTMAGLASQNFQTSRQELQHLLDGAVEANSFRRRRLVELAPVRMQTAVGKDFTLPRPPLNGLYLFFPIHPRFLNCPGVL